MNLKGLAFFASLLGIAVIGSLTEKDQSTRDYYHPPLVVSPAHVDQKPVTAEMNQTAKIVEEVLRMAVGYEIPNSVRPLKIALFFDRWGYVTPAIYYRKGVLPILCEKVEVGTLEKTASEIAKSLLPGILDAVTTLRSSTASLAPRTSAGLVYFLSNFLKPGSTRSAIFS